MSYGWGDLSELSELSKYFCRHREKLLKRMGHVDACFDELTKD